ncbi:FAD-containing oxidoreductase [Phenylobacterium immobile]|uniref:FAD-containing oxidoreductase n=1 Tax=Phenylobacterium immobile TaxID=21 RepID=UPI000AB16400|nr:FAD-containing oxidoreductase [Phenylobacterium immobile]
MSAASEVFDAIIVGAGQAGPPLAQRLCAAGMRVALIERGRFGGTCVNTGCMPTKALIASAHAAHIARRAADFGVRLSGEVGVDLAAVMARKDAIVARAASGVEQSLRALEGCTVLTGQASFEGPKTLRVGDATLSAEQIFLNVGGRALVPDMPGVSDVPVLNNSSIMALAETPRHLVVVGGSYVGLEFAQMFRRFGAEVTVVEKGPRVIGREDEEISAAVQAALEADGVVFRTHAECIRFAPHADGVAVGVDCREGAPEVVGSHVLLAVGRRPNTDDLNLEAAGIAVDGRGYIQVNDRLEASAAGIWALGDCNGRGAFTHTAYNDFEIVAANLLDGADRKVTDRIETYALFTDPPLGRVGLSEAQARAAGCAVSVATRPMTRVGRAIEKGETQGLMKLVADQTTGTILGAAILGVGGDEAIHAIVDLMAAGATAERLAQTVHIHPTVAELLPTLAGGLRSAD